jgi:hypothetical protein
MQNCQNFCIEVIQRRFSSANFVMGILATEPYFSNPELNSSKFVSMFAKLCLKSGGNFVGANSIRPEKSNDHSLIILHHERTLNEF